MPKIGYWNRRETLDSSLKWVNSETGRAVQLCKLANDEYYIILAKNKNVPSAAGLDVSLLTDKDEWWTIVNKVVGTQSQDNAHKLAVQWLKNHPYGHDSIKKEVKHYIRTRENGAEFSKIKPQFPDYKGVVKEIVNELLSDGDIYETKPGVLKVI